MRFTEFKNQDDDHAEPAQAADPSHEHDDVKESAHDESDGHDADDHSASEHAHEGEGEHAHEGHDGEITRMDHFMDPGHLFAHVQDSFYFEVPKFISKSGKIGLPKPLSKSKDTPMIGTASSPLKFVGRPTKFMVLELVGAVLLVLAFVWLAKKIKSGDKPTGKLWNFLETFVVFIRDEIARPSIGKSDADRFLPFLLTLFFFVLILNLFGMIPFLGSATGALGVTAVLAIVTFCVVVGAGMKRMGAVGFLKAQVPHMDLPKALAVILVPTIWGIEIFGLFVKHFVLALRLFANMFAGHLVLAVFLGIIGVTWTTMAGYFVGPTVVLGLIAFSALELFVAFLQAYVFTFLAALFIGSAIHPH